MNNYMKTLQAKALRIFGPLKKMKSFSAVLKPVIGWSWYAPLRSEFHETAILVYYMPFSFSVLGCGTPALLAWMRYTFSFQHLCFYVHFIWLISYYPYQLKLELTGQGAFFPQLVICPPDVFSLLLI